MTDDIEYGLEIDAIEKSFQGKNVAMIGLVDALGNSDGNNSYFERLIKAIDFSGINLAYFNAFFKEPFREHHIKEMILSNITLEEVKELQNVLENNGKPSKFFYGKGEKLIQSEDTHTALRDVITNFEDVSIFYSCGLQNMKYQMVEEAIQEQEMEQRKRNIALLRSLNPNIDIYQMGYPLPKEGRVREFLQKQNEAYQKIACDAGTVFVDLNEISCTARKNGQLCLKRGDTSKVTFRCLQEMYQRRVKTPKEATLTKEGNPFLQPSDFSSLGIFYMLEQSRQYVQQLIKDLPDIDLQFMTLTEIQEERRRQNIYRKILKK